PAGNYKVEINAPKFKTSSSGGVLVTAGSDKGIGTVKLTVGESREIVEVSAEAPLIETSQSQITNTFAGTELQTFSGIGENEGLVVNIITKSGTNTWHGSLYGNENNSRLNAMGNNAKRFTFVGGRHLTEPPRLNDEFGGFTIGGPWVKNKLFLFGGFNQEIINTTTPITGDAATPTPAGLAQLNGCFPGSATMQAWNRFGPYGISNGSPTPSPLPTDPANPDTRSFLSIPVSGCGTVQFGGVTRFVPQPTHNFNWVTRADWQLGGD